MPNQPTIEELVEENRRLRQENKRLAHNPAFGILTRNGFFEMYKKGARRNGWLVYIDLDYLHELNSELGKPAVDRLIKRSFRIRDNDLILKGQTHSGDEYGCVYTGRDPSPFANRLKDNFNRNGLSVTMVIVRIQRGNIKKAIDQADEQISKTKTAGTRGVVIIMN